MKNVLILKFPYSSAFGGGEFHTLTLVQNLSEKISTNPVGGFNFYLVSSCKVLLEEFKKRKWKAEKLWLGLEPVSIKGLIFFTLLLPYSFWRLFFILLKYKIKKKTNILYCLSLTEKLITTLPAKLLGYKIFWMEHLRIERWLLQNPYKIFYVLFSNFVTAIAVSKSVGKQLTDLGLKENKVKVIYNGINTNKFKPKQLPAINYLPQTIIGTSCRLNTEKGIDFLVKAFKKVIEQNIKAELWIAGEGPEEKNLKNLTRELNIENKIKFFGQVQDLSEFFNKIDIFALTSTRRESFGIAAAEAQACEKPAVVTNISGLAEVVENNITGFVVPLKNINEISLALTKLIENNNLRARFGKAGRLRVLKYFTKDKMISEFEKLFLNNDKN